MNPLFVLELRYLWRTAKSAVIWVLSFAVPLGLLAVIRRGHGDLLILLPLVVILCQSAATVWISRQTEPLALTVTLSPWTRIRARLLLMIVLAASAALVSAAATYPWGAQKGPHLAVHVLNLFLSCLVSSLAYAAFLPVVEGLSGLERIFTLLLISLVVLGLGLSQGILPGMPKLWIFLVTVAAILFVVYQRVQRNIEILPAGRGGGRERVPTEGPRAKSARPESFAVSERQPRRATGHLPLISLILAGCEMPVFLLQLIIFTTLALGAIFLPFLQVFGLFFVTFSLEFLFASHAAWASFLPSPYSRKKAFAAILLPVVLFLTLWTAARMICAFLWSTDWVLAQLSMEIQPVEAGDSPRGLLVFFQLQDAVILFFIFTVFLTFRPPRSRTGRGWLIRSALFILVYGLFLWAVLRPPGEVSLIQVLRKPAFFTAAALASLALLWRNYRVFRQVTLEFLPTAPASAASRPGPVWSGGG